MYCCDFTELNLIKVKCLGGEASPLSSPLDETLAGVFHVENSTLLIHGSVFSGNKAQHNGGVIFTILSSVAIDVQQSSFTYNQTCAW